MGKNAWFENTDVVFYYFRLENRKNAWKLTSKIHWCREVKTIQKRLSGVRKYFVALGFGQMKRHINVDGASCFIFVQI